MRLAAGGTVAAQATSPYYSRRAYWCVEATMAAGGLRTAPYHNYVPSLGSWGYVLGARTELATSELAVSVPTRYLDDQTARAMFSFPPDMGRVSVDVSRRFDPAIMRYYERDWKRWAS